MDTGALPRIRARSGLAAIGAIVATVTSGLAAVGNNLPQGLLALPPFQVRAAPAWIAIFFKILNAPQVHLL
jgi:hypothetical protein